MFPFKWILVMVYGLSQRSPNFDHSCRFFKTCSPTCSCWRIAFCWCNASFCRWTTVNAHEWQEVQQGWAHLKTYPYEMPVPQVNTPLPETRYSVPNRTLRPSSHQPELEHPLMSAGNMHGSWSAKHPQFAGASVCNFRLRLGCSL